MGEKWWERQCGRWGWGRGRERGSGRRDGGQCVERRRSVVNSAVVGGDEWERVVQKDLVGQGEWNGWVGSLRTRPSRAGRGRPVNALPPLLAPRATPLAPAPSHVPHLLPPCAPQPLRTSSPLATTPDSTATHLKPTSPRAHRPPHAPQAHLPLLLNPTRSRTPHPLGPHSKPQVPPRLGTLARESGQHGSSRRVTGTQVEGATEEGPSAGRRRWGAVGWAMRGFGKR